MTNQEAIAIALLARGYSEERRTGRYRKFSALGAAKPITKGLYFVLVGSNGAVRVTKSAIADSRSLTEMPIHAQLIAEGQPSRASADEIEI